MASPVLHTVRDRLTGRHLLAMAALLALVYGVTRSVDTVVGVVLALVFAETVQVLQETPTVDDRWVQVGIGAFVTVASLAWLAYELTAGAGTGGPAWFPGLTALVGVWFLLDARTAFAEGRARSSPPDDEMDAGDVMLVMSHAHLVTEELQSGPKTVAELAEACDLTESRVRESLDVATEEGIVYRTNADAPGDAERYALDESKVGGLAFVRSNGRRVLRRLARPFR